MRQPSVEMYLCAFHVGRWEADESVADAYHRALDITAAEFHRLVQDDCSVLKEKHTGALCKMMADRGVAVKTCSEAQKAPLWVTLVDEARKGGMRFPAA